MTYQNNGKGYNNNYNRSNQGTGYVGSPYNFIPFTDTICDYEKEQLPAHDKVSAELFSGEIPYTIETMTKTMVDDGSGHFYKDNYGRYAFPGSSIRGLIRSNTQVLSMSSVSDDVDDYALMFRNVANGEDKQKKRYAAILGAATIPMGNGTISVLKNVRAGYLINEGNRFFIYDTDLDRIGENFSMMNYYVLSERYIAEKYTESRQKRESFPFDFFTKKGNILQHDCSRPFNKEERNGRVQYKGTPNRDYKPYELPCSYEVNGRRITAVGEPGRYSKEGYAVSTGKMNMKKAVYIIPAMDKARQTRFDGEPMPIRIPEEDVAAFRVDINKRATTLKTFGGRNHFDLPAEGKMRPVFYIRLDGRLYFGFTPRLRLFYDHTIKEGMPAEHKKSELDYAKALFGYSNDKDSYKSRVSFSDAVIMTEGKESSGMEYAILGEPKPTSFMDYVSANGNNSVSYNDDGFSLRGMKQYWLRDQVESIVDDAKKGKDFTSKFCPLPQGLTFAGKVRFHNLTKAELGLLIWSLQLNGKNWMNIGKAKAFGFGNISLRTEAVRLLAPEKAYRTTTLLLDPYEIGDNQKFIDTFKAEISQQIGMKIDDVLSVKVLMAMKDPDKKPDPAKIRFMSIDAREYQSRKQPLQNVGGVLGDKTLENQIMNTGRKNLKQAAAVSSYGNSQKRNQGNRNSGNGLGNRSNGGYSQDNHGNGGTNSRDNGVSGRIQVRPRTGNTPAQATPTEQPKSNGIMAIVYKVDDFGNVILTKSEKIPNNARIQAVDVKGRQISAGDILSVKSAGSRAKNGKTTFFYKIVE